MAFPETVERTDVVRFFLVCDLEVLLNLVEFGVELEGAAAVGFRITLALKRFAITSMYGGMTIQTQGADRLLQRLERLTVARVPVLAQSLKHLGDLAVVFLLVNGSQVSDHHVCHGQRF